MFECSNCGTETNEPLTCQRCEVIYFCSEKCRAASAFEHDIHACLRLSNEVNKLLEEEEEDLGVVNFNENYRCEHLKRHGVHKKGMYRRECNCFDFVPFGELVIDSTEYVPKSDYQIEQIRGLIFLGHAMQSSSQKLIAELKRSPTSLVGFLPITIAHQIASNLSFDQNDLDCAIVRKIYIVGCGKEFDCIEQISRNVYELLSVKLLEVHFIGPELSKRMDNKRIEFCDGNVVSYMHKGLLGGGGLLDLPLCDFLFCPNAGITVYDTWKGAVEWFIQKCNDSNTKRKCTMIFTDFTYEAALRGHELLKLWTRVNTDETTTNEIKVTENAFKHPLLIRHKKPTTKQIREYSNGFLFGVSMYINKNIRTE